MPFIEQSKLGSLYKEIEEERSASDYFRKLSDINKRKVLRYRTYALISFALLFIGLITGIVFYLNISERSENLVKDVDDVTLEKKISPIEILFDQNDIRIYSVQIAATSDHSHLLFSENFVNFKATSIDDLTSYSIGVFATEEEAESFQSILIQMGITDAWVVAYENGKRIILND